MPSQSLILENEEQTHLLATRIAQQCRIGDAVLLRGGLGVGKSSFARGFINSFYDTPTEVPSPTFTLIQTYEIPNGEIWHCDLYRIEHEHDLHEIGIEDGVFGAITLVEWPDIADRYLSHNRLCITLDYGKTEGTRSCTIEGFGRFKDITLDD
jgi:tRNA threonylcarbamoyladenosine biosynthesis protein TsaE